jgi:hypothetical protein
MRANHVPPACIKTTDRHSEDRLAGCRPVTKPAIERLALNLKEVAQALGVSTPTVGQLRIPFIQAGTRKIYPVDAVKLWLLKQAEAISTSGDEPADGSQ